jgi:hypothetical protein
MRPVVTDGPDLSSAVSRMQVVSRAASRRTATVQPSPMSFTERVSELMPGAQLSPTRKVFRDLMPSKPAVPERTRLLPSPIALVEKLDVTPFTSSLSETSQPVVPSGTSKTIWSRPA